MSLPAVSVLLPFKNAEKYIDSALASIAGQTFEDFEVVLVNDKSVDSSVRIAEEWCSKDSRFVVVDSAGTGLVDALNNGLERCMGTWVARMDADDISLPDRIEKQLRLAVSMGLRTVVSCRIHSFPDSDITRGYRLSRTSSAYSITNFYRLKAKYLEYVPCMAGKNVFVAGSGQTARRLGKCLQDNGFHIEAFIDPSESRQGNKLRGRPVEGPGEFSKKPDIPVVIASRLPGARESIMEFLNGLGFIEWKNYVACS